MDWKELKNKSQTELSRLLDEQRDKLRDLNFKDASRQLKDVREVRETRKTVARILTLLSGRKEKR